MATDAVLPNFIIVGAARSGTSSTHFWLDQDPRVFMSPIKETNYFAQVRQPYTGPGDWDDPPLPLPRNAEGRIEKFGSAHLLDWDVYLSLFEEGGGYAARGEASPAYLYYSECAHRIHADIPECKIVILLRDPADRAISMYKALMSWGFERVSLREALRLGAERVQGGWSWCWDLLGGSTYAPNVERYLRTFGADRVGVFLFEDLLADPVAFYEDVCGFLELGPPSFHPDFRVQNASDSSWEVGVQSIRRKLPAAMQAYRLVPESWRRAVRPACVKILGVREMPVHSSARDELHDYFADDILQIDQLRPRLHVVERWLARRVATLDHPPAPPNASNGSAAHYLGRR